MRKIIYPLAVLFCFAGCQKQEVSERMEITRVSFINKTQLASNPSIRYENQVYNILDLISTTYGDHRVEVVDAAGVTLLDTILKINGRQDFYIYQPFDIVPPAIVDSLPAHAPVDPRNLLKDEAPAPEGYIKMKIAYQTQFVLPGQQVSLLVLSTTAASPDVPVPIDTLEHIGAEYNDALLQVKRPVLADGSLSQAFFFSLIDPATGERIKTGNGDNYKGGSIALPLGEKNLFMFYFNDRQNASRFAASSIPVNGLYYVLAFNLLWSIE